MGKKFENFKSKIGLQENIHERKKFNEGPPEEMRINVAIINEHKVIMQRVAKGAPVNGEGFMDGTSRVIAAKVEDPKLKKEDIKQKKTFDRTNLSVGDIIEVIEKGGKHVYSIKEVLEKEPDKNEEEGDV